MEKAVFLFDLTGIMAKPWADAGYLCYCFDGQHPPGVTKSDHENILNVGMWFYAYETKKSFFMTRRVHRAVLMFCHSFTCTLQLSCLRLRRFRRGCHDPRGAPVSRSQSFSKSCAKRKPIRFGRCSDSCLGNARNVTPSWVTCWISCVLAPLSSVP